MREPVGHEQTQSEGEGGQGIEEKGLEDAHTVTSLRLHVCVCARVCVYGGIKTDIWCGKC